MDACLSLSRHLLAVPAKSRSQPDLARDFIRTQELLRGEHLITLPCPHNARDIENCTGLINQRNIDLPPLPTWSNAALLVQFHIQIPIYFGSPTALAFEIFSPFSTQSSSFSPLPPFITLQSPAVLVFYAQHSQDFEPRAQFSGYPRRQDEPSRHVRLPSSPLRSGVAPY